MSTLQTVKLSEIDPNPMRMLDKYPYVERKVEALVQSIKSVGLWEGVIGRMSGERVQLAFGHHRIEAARRAGLDSATLIIRDLTDEEMLKFMGRENMEDYNSDFLSLLETWEAGHRFLLHAWSKAPKATDIAKLLGWTRTTPTHDVTLSHAASACHSAFSLISGGYLDRRDLVDLSVKAAQVIVERAQARMEQLERVAKEARYPREVVETAKKQVGKAAVKTARDFKEGKVKSRDLRSEVDVNAYRFASEEKRQTLCSPSQSLPRPSPGGYLYCTSAQYLV